MQKTQGITGENFRRIGVTFVKGIFFSKNSCTSFTFPKVVYSTLSIQCSTLCTQCSTLYTQCKDEAGWGRSAETM